MSDDSGENGQDDEEADAVERDERNKREKEGMKTYETEQCWVDECVEESVRGKGLCVWHVSCEIFDVLPGTRRCQVVGCDKVLKNTDGCWVEAPELEEEELRSEAAIREEMDEWLDAGVVEQVGTTPWGAAIYQNTYSDPVHFMVVKVPDSGADAAPDSSQ